MNKILILIISISVISTSLNAQCDPVPTTCCSYEFTDTLDYSEFSVMYMSPHTSITPPDGYAVRLVKPTIMKVYNDGSTLFFASGEYVSIENDRTPISGNYMGQFPDPFLYENGIYSSSYWHSYQCVYNGELIPSSPSFTSSGRVMLTSTYPITGGGSNPKLIFIFTYELVPY